MPAIAVELLAAVRIGLELRGDSRWPEVDRTLDATPPHDDPSALVAAIRMLFNSLSVQSRRTLQVAALAAEPFTNRTIAAAVEGTFDVQLELDRLEWEQWLVSDARGYSFGARAVRRVVAAEMTTAGMRRRILERLA